MKFSTTAFLSILSYASVVTAQNCAGLNGGRCTRAGCLWLGGGANGGCVPITSAPVPAPTTAPPTTEAPVPAPTNAPPSGLVAAPSCIGGGYTCLQNSDFGVVGPADWGMDLQLEVLDSNSVGAYVSARAKWRSVITGNLVSISSSGLMGDPCSNAYPAIIDDIHICGRDVPIDGAGAVLGRAGPTYLRTSDGTSISGFMEFDVADVATLIASGSWEAVILHEMGHVIGIGTLWDYNNLVDNNLNYLGPNAQNVWSNTWGCTSSAPPVETDGGPGTAGGHWDEACLLDELMTGFLTGSLPLSALTIATLEDIGYTVDYSSADAYDGCDTTCCGNSGCRRNLLRSSSEENRNLQGMGKPPLSAEGRGKAVAHGRSVLRERQLPPGQAREKDGVKYVGDLFISVLVEEGGFIYEVGVSAD